MLALGRRYPPFWWYPTLSLVVGLVVGALLGRLDVSDGSGASFVLYPGGAEAARSLVTLGATALATITTFTLSTTVVTLQLASSQHSPRLIEQYLNDRVSHAVFSLFFGSFAFAIAILLNIRLPGVEEEPGRVPRVAVSVLVVLLVACLVALIFFVHRVTTSMRVESILRRLSDRTVESIERRGNGGDHDDPDRLPPPPADSTVIRSRRSGYYADIHRDRIEEFVPEDWCCVWILVAPGDFVTTGSPVAIVSGAIDESIVDEIESWLRFDAERWIEADYSYGIRNLVDIALKALSPGINDPTTASMAIERIGETMAVAGRRRPDRSLRTEAGTDVFLTIREWDETLETAVRHIVQFGRRDVTVVVSLLRMLAGLAWADTEIDRRPTIRSVAGHLRTWLEIDVARAAWDVQRIDAEFELLERALARDPLADWHHPL